MNDQQERLMTIRQVLTTILFRYKRRGITHNERNLVIQQLINIIDAWQAMDIDQANQMTQISEDEIPF